MQIKTIEFSNFPSENALEKWSLTNVVKELKSILSQIEGTISFIIPVKYGIIIIFSGKDNTVRFSLPEIKANIQAQKLC